MHLITVSPSISSRSRNTPCVDGCCGPMFRIIVRSCAGSSSGVGLRCAILAISLHWVILTERMTFPVLGHHDAPHIWVSHKAHTEKIEDLEFEEVRGSPQTHERFDRRVSPWKLGDYADSFFSRVCEQAINHFKARLRREDVDASNVYKKV